MAELYGLINSIDNAQRNGLIFYTRKKSKPLPHTLITSITSLTHELSDSIQV